MLALLVLQLADEPLLSCDLRTYAAAVRANAVHLADFIQSRQDRGLTRRLDVASLHAAADRLVSEAAKWMQFEDEWMGRMYAGNGRESPELYNARIRHNGRMTDFDSHLLDLPSPTNPAPNGVSDYFVLLFLYPFFHSLIRSFVHSFNLLFKHSLTQTLSYSSLLPS